MRRAEEIAGILLDEADAAPRAIKRVRPVSRPDVQVVYKEAGDAAITVPRSGWREWREAGVQFSKFHVDRTAFALPFRPDDYLWAGPFTLAMPEQAVRRRGHYRRGVRRYASMLAKGLKLPPVVLLYQEARGWTMQDGNHRFEALVNAEATTYDAFLGKPKKKQASDSL